MFVWDLFYSFWNFALMIKEPIVNACKLHIKQGHEIVIRIYKGIEQWDFIVNAEYKVEM